MIHMDMHSLLNVSTSTPLSTVVKVCREGDYKAMIDDGDKWLTFRDGDSTKGINPQAIVLFSIIDDGVRKELGRDKVLIPQTNWLDVTEGGQLDLSEGKNVGLGRLLAAAGLNGAGNLFENVQKLRGKGPFMVKVGQRSDKVDPNVKYAEIRKVAPISS